MNSVHFNYIDRRKNFILILNQRMSDYISGIPLEEQPQRIKLIYN